MYCNIASSEYPLLDQYNQNDVSCLGLIKSLPTDPLSLIVHPYLSQIPLQLLGCVGNEVFG